MWPFETRKKKAVVVFHIDHDGHARGAYFRGDADVLIIDEREPQNRAYRMQTETTDQQDRRQKRKQPNGAKPAGETKLPATTGAHCAQRR